MMEETRFLFPRKEVFSFKGDVLFLIIKLIKFIVYSVPYFLCVAVFLF